MSIYQRKHWHQLTKTIWHNYKIQNSDMTTEQKILPHDMEDLSWTNFSLQLQSSSSETCPSYMALISYSLSVYFLLSKTLLTNQGKNDQEAGVLHQMLMKTDIPPHKARLNVLSYLRILLHGKMIIPCKFLQPNFNICLIIHRCSQNYWWYPCWLMQEEWIWSWRLC